MRTQEFFHWLEEGGGVWLVTRLALVLGLIALTVFYGLRRLEGPGSEMALERLVVARHVADGHGITTGVVHPQAAAVLEQRGHAWKPGEPMPELYHAPLYPWLTGKVLGLLPERARAAVWRDPVVRSDNSRVRFGGDLAVFWLNWLGFMALVGLTYALATSMFGPRAGVVAAIGLAASQGFWVRLLELGGVVLPAALLVGLGLVVWAFERARADAESGDEQDDAAGVSPRWGPQYARVVGAGALLGLLFLTEYAALWLVPGIAIWLAVSGRGLHRATLPVVALAVAAVIAGPWWARNIGITGDPLGLASQALVLKAEDPTAEPGILRATLAADRPEFHHRKVLHKGLEALEKNLSGGLWKEGGGLFLAFMVAGLLHRFRVPAINRTRWVLVGLAALVVIGAGFTGDRTEPVPAAAWVVPIWMVTGAAFLGMLADSGGRSAVLRVLWVAAIVGLHAAPMLRGLTAPSSPMKARAPYAPHVAAVVRQEILAAFPDEGAMSDLPAGMAWYGAMQAWNQPATYRDFFAIHLRNQELAVLYLTPNRMDEPFFSKLAISDPETAVALRSGESADWALLYRGLAGRNIPAFFPLPQVLPLGSNIFVLVKPNLSAQSTRR